MFDGGGDLSKDDLRLVLGHLPSVGDARVQIAIGRVLGDDVNLLGSFDHFVQTDDVRVVQLLRRGDLSREQSLSTGI